MQDVNKLLDELTSDKEKISYDLINFKKYLDILKDWLKGMTLYPILHDFLKHILTVILNTVDGMFEFSASFKFADLVSVEFTGKLEIPMAIEFPMANAK